jgi:hypothetical protein
LPDRYFDIYLLTEQRWDEAGIDVVMSIATFAGILAQNPGGRFTLHIFARTPAST